MEPSMVSTQGMPNNWSQNSETRFPTHGTTSRGSSNDHGTLNSTLSEFLIPMPKYVQGSWVIASDRTEYGVKEPTENKRYRKANVHVKIKKSSAYRGVTKCKGRFQSFVWDNDHLRTDGKKGKTVYIGGFKYEHEAARAHDLIAIKIWGKSAYTNFPVICYLNEISEMKSMTKRECVLAVRRQSKDSSMYGSSDNVSRNEEGAISSSPIEQTADDDLSNKRDNEACDPSHANFEKSLKLSTLEQHNRDQLEQHVTTSSAFDGQQNHDGFSAFARVGFEMEENNAIGDTFPNLDSTTGQARLLEIGQEYQALIDMQQNQQVSAKENPFDNQFLLYDQYQGLAFENDLNFQNDLSFPRSFDSESTLVENHTNPLDNALNWESSMYMENPRGAENGGGSSFGFGSIGFHSMEPNIQEFEAPNLQVAPDQRYEPFQHGFETNTSFQGEKKVENENDLDKSKYLNLNNPNMEDPETTHDWIDCLDELWSKVEADRLEDWWFDEDGTQL